MKICVISSSVLVSPPPGYAGLEMITWQQAKGLAEKGHKVTLIAPQGSTCPNVEIIQTGPPGQWDERKSYQGYWKRLLEFDCIIDSSWSKWSYILKAEGTLKCPVLGVTHAPVDTMFKELPPGVDKPCFVCISQDQANHFQALFGRPARVAWNGFDAETFYKPLNMPRTDRFLFLARFSTIKGPDIAIEACLKAGVGLDLVGDTSITGEPELYNKCKSLADGKQIRIIGGVSRGECVYWFSQAHAFLHPNKLFREPAGLAPLEAQACGLPVIAWRYGALQESVREDTGILVSSMDDLVNAINTLKQPMPQEIRDRCRIWAKSFSVERMVLRYEELCNEAVQTGGW